MIYTPGRHRPGQPATRSIRRFQHMDQQWALPVAVIVLAR